MRTQSATIARTRPSGAIALLLGTGALMGLSATLSKVAADAGLAAPAYLAWSALGGAVALVAWSRVRRTGGDAPPLRFLVVAALLSFALPNLLLYAAVPHVGAGFAALALAFPPLYTYLGALALGIERFCRWRMLGVGLALGGAAWLSLHTLDAMPQHGAWIAVVLSVPVILAAGNLYRSLRWPPGASASRLAPGMLAVSALVLLAAGALTPLPVRADAGSALHLALLALQSCVFAAQYQLFLQLQQRSGPVLLSLVGSVAAMTAVPLAILVLGEPAPAGLAVGAMLVAAGVAFALRRPPA